MANGCFTVAPDADRRDIVFRTKPDAAADIPEEQLALKDHVEHSLTVLRTLFPAVDLQFENYYRPLLSLAQLGLAADPARPQIAVRALVALKNEVVAREAGRIKNRYMKRLGFASVAMGAPALAATAVMRRWFPMQMMFADFLTLWAGCMGGVWLSFGARKFALSFDDLHIPEADRLEPAVRLLFAGLLTVVLGLSFSVGAVVVTVGSVTTTQINQSFRISLLLGLLCGFSEQILTTRVAKQASSFLDFGK